MYPTGRTPKGQTSEPSPPAFFQDLKRQVPTRSSAFNALTPSSSRTKGTILHAQRKPGSLINTDAFVFIDLDHHVDETVSQADGLPGRLPPNGYHT
jgi:hypothetical protein